MLEPFFRDALRHLQEYGEAEFYTIEQALRFMKLIESGVLVSTGVGWTVRLADWASPMEE